LCDLNLSACPRALCAKPKRVANCTQLRLLAGRSSKFHLYPLPKGRSRYRPLLGLLDAAYALRQQGTSARHPGVGEPNLAARGHCSVPGGANPSQNVVGALYASKTMIAKVVGPLYKCCRVNSIPGHTFKVAEIHFCKSWVLDEMQVFAQRLQGLRQLGASPERRDVNRELGRQNAGQPERGSVRCFRLRGNIQGSVAHPRSDQWQSMAGDPKCHSCN